MRVETAFTLFMLFRLGAWDSMDVCVIKISISHLCSKPNSRVNKLQAPTLSITTGASYHVLANSMWEKNSSIQFILTATVILNSHMFNVIMLIGDCLD